MTRLFWKFFVIIWVSLTLSIAAAFAVVTNLRAPPFAEELRRSQNQFALATTEKLLQSGNLQAAQAFVTAAASGSDPVSLTLKEMPAGSLCDDPATGTEHDVRLGAECYRVTVAATPTTPLLHDWPKLLPWVSAVIASLVAAYGLALFLTRPVENLRKGMNALANGRFDVRIAGKLSARRDEIASLVHDFDITAHRLQEMQAAQQRLFHDVSHELRSPLSRLQAAFGVLRQSPAKLDALIDRMDREIERMDNLVGEILMLARLSSQEQSRMSRQAIDVMDLIDEIVADAAFEGQARGIAVAAASRSTFVARVNGELIYRAIENIVRNALKYAPDNSTIRVDCQVNDDTLKVVITDEGPGVEAADIEQIFAPFVRSKDATPDGGSGLGLAIAKRAVEVHGGTISATSGPPGGFAVSMTIPRG